MNIGNKKAQDSKQAILKALLELMEVDPISDITISQIAGRAGVSRPTFYRNFKDKEDVLAIKIDEIIDRYLDRHVQMDRLSVQTIAPLLFDVILSDQRFFQLLVENRLLYLFMDPLYTRLIHMYRSKRPELWEGHGEEDVEIFFTITFGAFESFVRLHIHQKKASVKIWTEQFLAAVRLLEPFMD